jgi:hypothetical protein
MMAEPDALAERERHGAPLTHCDEHNLPLNADLSCPTCKAEWAIKDAEIRNGGR